MLFVKDCKGEPQVEAWPLEEKSQLPKDLKLEQKGEALYLLQKKKNYWQKVHESDYAVKDSDGDYVAVARSVFLRVHKPKK